MSFTRMSLRAVPLCAWLLLAACAGDVAKPVAVQALSTEQQASLKIANVTGEAQAGVELLPYEIDRMMQQIKLELSKTAIFVQPPTPGVTLASTAAAAPPGTTSIKLVFTEYDKGNAFARAMLIGLGQIKIGADVFLFDDATGKQVGQYRVSKQFAFGGIYGATTRIEDVEAGFAKSVAEIAKPAK